MKARLLQAVVFLCGLGLLLSGCGKKAPPFLPKGRMPLAVRDLKAAWDNGEAVLTGRIPTPSGEEGFLQDVTAYRVYRGWYPLESPPCEGCPIDYMGYETFRAQGTQGPEFYVRFPVADKRGIFFFEVRLVGGRGAIGPVSNTAKLVGE